MSTIVNSLKTDAKNAAKNSQVKKIKKDAKGYAEDSTLVVWKTARVVKTAHMDVPVQQLNAQVEPVSVQSSRQTRSAWTNGVSLQNVAISIVLTLDITVSIATVRRI